MLGCVDARTVRKRRRPADFGLVPTEEVLELSRSRPRWIDLIATGRNAPAALTELADTVSEVQGDQAPLQEGHRAARRDGVLSRAHRLRRARG